VVRDYVKDIRGKCVECVLQAYRYSAAAVSCCGLLLMIENSRFQLKTMPYASGSVGVWDDK
jgi:hypothetical protein